MSVKFFLRIVWAALFVCLGMIFSSGLAGQTNPLQTETTEKKPAMASVFMPGIGLGVHVPGGLLNERYGASMHINGTAQYLTKNNWIAGADWHFLFGSQVKEDVLAPYRTATGVIPGDDEQIADIFLRQRGIWAGAGLGRLFPFSDRSRSGLKAMVHGGVLQHYIHFTDERNSVAQVRAGRYVGYDRLTRGFSVKQTVGYLLLSNDRRLNFELALEAIQAWTAEVRDVNFDTGLPTNPARFDWMFGVRINWYLPFYSGSEEQVYY